MKGEHCLVIISETCLKTAQIDCIFLDRFIHITFIDCQFKPYNSVLARMQILVFNYIFWLYLLSAHAFDCSQSSSENASSPSDIFLWAYYDYLLYVCKYKTRQYPQSNGFVEAMVKVVIILEEEESGSDPHLAMLIYRARPIRPGPLSPAQLLSQRKYQALLPVHQYLPRSLEQSREALIAQKQSQVDHFDRTPKQLQDLQLFQSVHIQLDPKKNLPGRKPLWSSSQLTSHLEAMRCRLNPAGDVSGIIALYAKLFRTSNEAWTKSQTRLQNQLCRHDLNHWNISVQLQPRLIRLFY